MALVIWEKFIHQSNHWVVIFRVLNRTIEWWFLEFSLCYLHYYYFPASKITRISHSTLSTKIIPRLPYQDQSMYRYGIYHHHLHYVHSQEVPSSGKKYKKKYFHEFALMFLYGCQYFGFILNPGKHPCQLTKWMYIWKANSDILVLAIAFLLFVT